MKRKVIIGSAIGLAIAAAIPLVWAGTSFAHGAGGHCLFARGSHHAGGFGELRELKQKLDLTEEQVAALREIARRTHQQNAVVRDSLKGSFADAAQVLLADPANITGAQTVLDQNQAAVEQMKATILASVSEGLKVLTPAQRQKLATWLTQHRKAE